MTVLFELFFEIRAYKCSYFRKFPETFPEISGNHFQQFPETFSRKFPEKSSLRKKQKYLVKKFLLQANGGSYATT
eukprot:UN16583